MSKDNDNNEDHEDGSALWQVIAKTIKPLKNNLFHPALEENKKQNHINNPSKPLPVSKKNFSKKESVLPEGVTPKNNAAGMTQQGGQELDGRLNERLRRGQIEIDVTVDLHGHSQREAHHILQTTILTAYKAKKRCVLVITGKGRHSGRRDSYDLEPGILKKMTPQWLSEPPLSDVVLKTHTARPKDGGSGALYVLLRRHRSV